MRKLARILSMLPALLLLLFALIGSADFASAQDYYHRFLSLAMTNDTAFELTSPFLVDTNNSGFKLTNSLLFLETIRTNSALSGVRPGMTMDDVVARWGKPLQCWIRGFEGPRLVYKEVSVFFDPTTNAVKSIFTHDLPSLERMLSVFPTMDQCIRALGNPSLRQDSSVGKECFLIYETPRMVLKVGCVRGKLSTLQLDRPE